jgi:hypothetical protein
MANIINQYGQVKLGVRSTSAPLTLSYLLDTYSGAAAAYSLRKLRAAYTGAAIRVRRSSDNTSQDIGFNGSGGLDTTALTSFIGSSDAFVAIWYDQSGRANNIENVTLAAQPQIAQSGVIVTQFGKPSVRFNGSSWALSKSTLDFTVNGLTTMSIISVVNTIADDSTSPRGLMGIVPDSGWGTVTQGCTIRRIGWRFGTGQSSNTMTFTLPSNTNNSIISTYHNNNTEILRTNGVDRITYTDKLSTIANTGQSLIVGFNYVYGSASYHSGTISEMIIFTNNQIENRAAIETAINTNYTVYPTDVDAQAFITAAVITDQTQQTAINTLVTDLKTAGIWTKMKALYPFVGGTAAQHRFNLKDPRAVDAAYYLTFYGGGTHSANGYLPNGNSYADTKLIPSVDLSTNSGFGYYSITNSTTGNQSEMGAINYDMPSLANVRVFQSAHFGNVAYFGVNSQDSQTFTDTDTRGFYQAYRTDSTTFKTLKNSTLYTSILPYYPTPLTCYLGARNERNIAQLFSSKGLALAYFQSNFTDADATAFYTAVQKYQTTLGRAV